jgi:predicted aminopeptidase
MLPEKQVRRAVAAALIARVRVFRIAIAVLAVATLAISLSGCEINYLARGAYEEMRLLWNRKPIDEVLARSDIPADTRAKLTTVLEVRDFARQRLGLKVGGAYQTVAEVDSGAIVWVVMAAPRDSLRPVTWWFPIVGRVPYRGYFDHGAALAEAKSLDAAGYDTFVRPAVAFSTLGFFNDPLLSNLLKLNRVELAGVLIHELFHRTFFLASNAMFDESAATWVGSRGAVDFFTATGGPNSADARAARGMLESELAFASFLLQAEARLLRLYQSGLSHDEIVRRREPLFVKIKSDYAALKPRLSGLERFDLDREPLNNAVLINYLIYFHQLWNFAALDQKHNHDTRATIQVIIELARANPGDPFYAIWEATRSAMPLTPR